MTIPLSWPPKYPDEAYTVGYDWAALIPDGDSISGIPTATVLDNDTLIVGTCSYVGTLQKIPVRAGTPNRFTRLKLLATLTSGELIEDVVGLPVRNP